jgi:hypothetical protein
VGKRRLQFDSRVRLRFGSLIKPLAAGSLTALGEVPRVFWFSFSSPMLRGGIRKAAGASRDCRHDTGIQQPHRGRDTRPGLRHGCSHAGRWRVIAGPGAGAIGSHAVSNRHGQGRSCRSCGTCWLRTARSGNGSSLNSCGAYFPGVGGR